METSEECLIRYGKGPTKVSGTLGREIQVVKNVFVALGVPRLKTKVMTRQASILCGLLLTLLSAQSFCQSRKGKTVSIIKHGKNIEYHINTALIKDTLHIKLSDYTSDYEFIRLETTEEGLIGGCVDYYIGNEYFLCEERGGGIFQFGRDGKFIRKIVHRGKGPTEIQDADWTVDETKQILYVTDRAKKNYFLSYDLATGKYLGDIKKAISAASSKIEILDSKTIMANTYMGNVPDGRSTALYWQDLSGSMIKSVPANPNEKIFFSYLTYSRHDDQFRVKMLGNDTVFSILDGQLIPYLTFTFGKKNPPNRFHMGFTTIRIDREVEPWIMLDVDIINEILKNNDGEIVSLSSKVKSYMVDKNMEKAYFRGSLFIDPVHHTEKWHWVFYNRNGNFVKPFDAVNFLDLAEKALADPDFREPYRSKLEAAIDGLSEEDNPVLLIGKFK